MFPRANRWVFQMYRLARRLKWWWGEKAAVGLERLRVIALQTFIGIGNSEQRRRETFALRNVFFFHHFINIFKWICNFIILLKLRIENAKRPCEREQKGLPNKRTKDGRRRGLGLHYNFIRSSSEDTFDLLRWGFKGLVRASSPQTLLPPAETCRFKSDEPLPDWPSNIVQIRRNSFT